MTDKEIDANFPKNRAAVDSFKPEPKDLQKAVELTETASPKQESRAPEKEMTGQTTTADFFGVLKRRRPRPAIPQPRDETTVKIEKILEDGVGEAYSRLSPVAKQEFKLKGEEVAFKIRELLSTGHTQVKKIFRLILEWLKMLPGINRFFLEQEAKIKTDRVLSLSKQNQDTTR
ncbi:MAG: hypothetical protein Q7K39_04040 [Candidatus Magasanikbacteria bacterium]|nr:hypothetical protein [Candidatus Magasanikbacteria bacterium]